LDSQRKVIWKEIDYGSNAKNEITEFAKSLAETDRKPIVSLKIKGKRPKDIQPLNFAEVEKMFSNKAILNLNKTFGVESFEENIQMLRELKEQRLSPEEQGLNILRENLKQCNCNIKIDELFDLLVNGETDLVLNLLTGAQKTLGGFNG
jgi:hypothetical protein